jgi:Tol biopolymer transport system component
MKHRKSILFVLFLAFTLSALGQQATQDYKILFEKAKFTMETKGDLKGAITLFGDLIKKYPKEREYAAKSQLYIGLCYEKLGVKEAQKAYESVLANYADQPEPTKVARERLSAITNRAASSKGNTEVAMRRIWEAGHNFPISVSPDGKYVIYQSTDDGDIWLHNIQSGEQRRVTRESSALKGIGNNGTATISQDGKWIAYDWSIWSDEKIRVSTLDGSSMKTVFNGEMKRAMYPVAWMPDNHKLLTVSLNRDDNSWMRHIVSIPDGTILNIGQPAKEAMQWGLPSPDGRYILYDYKRGIFIYDATTGKDTVLIQNPSENRYVGWTPNGSGLLFSSDQSGSRDLYQVGFSHGQTSGEPVILKRDIGFRLYPTHDGQILSIVDIGNSNSFTATVDKQTGKVTGTPQPVDTNYPESYLADWSHDGKLLYYLLYKKEGSSNNRSPVLVIRTEETGQTREIIPKSKLTECYGLTISPDGRNFMVVGSFEDMNAGIYSINSASGEVSLLVKIPKSNLNPFPNWSPDGKAIFYKLRSPVKGEGFIIRHRDLITGDEQEVYKGNTHTREMQISADGTRFVYFSSETKTKSFTLGILDLPSGKNQVLASFPESEATEISGPSWAPDGKHVLVCKNFKKGCELWRFPVAGGEGDKLYSSPDYSWGFALHPNGKRILFGQSRHNFELWVMENLLPK